MFKYLRKLKIVRTTRNELSRLSDRELSDLGISRFDIETIARQSAMGQN